MDGQSAGTGLGERFEVTLRFDDHQVDIQG
jgi:hypothetical protein